jgi:membrane-bound metal-dependent hydrolase YbcI (DUF457 family)
MFLGHFGLALAAKKAAPKTSLGALVLSAQFADCLWPVLLLLGVEQVRIVPGITAVTPLDFVSYPISHSLLVQLVWGFLLGALYFRWRRDLATATLLGSLLPTHWLLDYFSHRPDMPLYPGGPRVGLGLWNSIPLTLVVEYGLFVAGLVLYLSATRSKGGRNYGFWSLVVFLATLYPASVFGPPPPSVRVLALSAMAIWLTIPWAAWGDSQRQPKPQSPIT